MSPRGDAFSLGVNPFRGLPFARTRHLSFGDHNHARIENVCAAPLAGLAACGALLLAACGDDGMSGMGEHEQWRERSRRLQLLQLRPRDGHDDRCQGRLPQLHGQHDIAAVADSRRRHRWKPLPATTKVDFAQLVDLTEVISAGQIPAAEYVSATLTLDYTGANITADDGTGTAVALKPVDSNGAALAAPVTVSVKLDNAHHLLITAGRTGRLAFDFNLAASNTVDLTAATVTVSPTLVATVVPSDNKQVRVRGQFVSASTTANDFVLNVQPFHDQTKTNGQATVTVGMATTYQVNGMAYVGAAGLAALAALPANTMVAAFGSLQTSSQTFTATTVLAGTSFENPSKDMVSGTVIARSANTLTLRRATFCGRDGDFESENHDVTVTVADGTAVTEEGTTGTFTIADISVGQHIDAFGTSPTASERRGGAARRWMPSAGSVRLGYDCRPGAS